MLIVQHMPKTAGTTLRAIVEKKYGRQDVFRYYYEDQEAGKRDLMDWYAATAGRPNRLIVGHFTYGIHELVPEPCRYIVILRDPVELLVSYYYFVLRDKANILHARVVGERMSLVDFISSGCINDLDNHQTRFLAGAPCGAPVKTPFGGADEEMLERARKNLAEHYDLVGLTEEFEASLVLLRRLLDWESVPLYTSQNVTARRPSSDTLPPETRGLLERYTRLDYDLYGYARQQMDERIAKEGPCFETELRVFQAAVRDYGALSKPGDNSAAQELAAIKSSRLWRYSRPFVHLAQRLKRGRQ